MSRKNKEHQTDLRLLLRGKLIDFQREIGELKRTSTEQKETFQTGEQDLLTELFAVLDGFDNLEKNIRDKEDSLDKTGSRLVKNTRAIKRKLLRLLSSRNIEPMEPGREKAQMELCKVVDTQVDFDREDEEILSVEKTGYIDIEQNIILRKAEVVTVCNEYDLPLDEEDKGDGK